MNSSTERERRNGRGGRTEHDDWYWLGDDETVVWEGRPRLTTIAGSVVLGASLTIASIGLTVAVDPWLVVLAPVGVLIAVLAYLRVRKITYLVTTRAIWMKTGLVGQSVRRVTLSRVQNTGFQQSVRGSLFGYGTVTIEIAGGRDFWFRRISEPQAVQEAINERLGRRRDPDIPGSAEQWRAILAAVRSVRTAMSHRN